MGYAGVERRIHRVYLTRNTEYHMRGNVCIGVRDRETGRWLQDHDALQTRLAGGLRFCDQGSIVANPGQPSIGESLFFHVTGRDLITSTVQAVERPPRDTVKTYTQLAS